MLIYAVNHYRASPHSLRSNSIFIDRVIVINEKASKFLPDFFEHDVCDADVAMNKSSFQDVLDTLLSSR